MNDFFKSKRRLLMATGMFCVLILSGVLLTSGTWGDSILNSKPYNAGALNNLELRVLVYPEKYALTSSSLPGIRKVKT